jgi:D-alanine-D-alanine ligase
MNRRRVLVLVHPSLVPPATLHGVTEQQYDEWRTEYDVVSGLRAAGHELRVVGVDDSLDELRQTLIDWRPQVVFNLLEEFNGIVSYDQHVVAFLELLCQPYTGCNPRGLLLARDKALCKRLLQAHAIATPPFVLWSRGLRAPSLKSLRFPLFVKSATDDASLGISQASVVANLAQLRARVQFMHQQIGSDALVEEFVAGREFYVGVIGNERPRSLPVWELQFGQLPCSKPAVATRKLKWDRAYQRKYGIGTRRATGLPPMLTQRLGQLARQVYRSLQLSGYARIDFRVAVDGRIFVLEANPNPNLAEIEDFAASAAAAGLSYAATLERIMRLGLNYRAAWRKPS